MSRKPSAAQGVPVYAMRNFASALLLLSLVALFPAAQAEDPPKQTLEGAGVDIAKPGAQNLPIALPDPQGQIPQEAEIWAVVRRDLEASGYFKIIDPAGYLEKPEQAGIAPGTFNYADWDLIGTVVLAKSSLKLNGTQVQAELYVYDVPGQRKLGGKAFSADGGNARYVGHRIADEIIFQVTGQKGIFSTRFAAVTAASGTKEVALVDVDGHGVRYVTRNGSINLQPAWSPGGDRIAFTSYRAGNPDLYIADLGSGKVTRLSARQGVNLGAAWAPNGDKIAVTLTSGPNGDTDIFLLNTAGAQLAQLTKEAGIDVSAAFSPDGSQIVFCSERSGGVQIYVMPATGGSARRVTFSGNHNTDPSWSPKGDKIAFVGRDKRFDVFTVGVDGTGMQRVTQDQGDNEDPSWSPDGRYIAFSSTRTGGGQIWMSTADGRVQTQVTTSGGPWTNPAWGPWTQ